jgi:hypothetical protein
MLPMSNKGLVALSVFGHCLANARLHERSMHKCDVIQKPIHLLALYCYAYRGRLPRLRSVGVIFLARTLLRSHQREGLRRITRPFSCTTSGSALVSSPADPAFSCARCQWSFLARDRPDAAVAHSSATRGDFGSRLTLLARAPSGLR